MNFQSFNKIRILVLTFMVGIIYAPNAQSTTFGNEWLSVAGNMASSDQFYKIKIVEDGIYRITYQELADAGFPFNNLDPNYFQLWRRGVQQSIIVGGESDGSFDPGDYIEFYGKHNDGQLDNQLFWDSTLHIHPYYSNYTDTAAYILTLGTGALRTQNLDGTSTNYGTFESEYTRQNLTLFTNLYHYGKNYFNPGSDDYEPMAFGDRGEGWFSTTFGSSRVVTLNGFKDVNTASTSNVTLEIVLVSVDNSAAKYSAYYKTNSDPSYTLLEDSIALSNYNAVKRTYSLNASDLRDASNDGVLKLYFSQKSGSNSVALAYVKVTFPQETKLDANPTVFDVSTTSGSIVLELDNATSTTFLYEVTQEGNYRKFSTEYIGGTGKARTKFSKLHSTEKLLATDQYLSSPDIEKFTFISPNTNADYLIISHPRLISSATNYKNYRQSTDGGGYRVELSMVGDLYNTFSYGDYTPLAIRRYCNYQITNGVANFLLLIGKGFPNVKYDSKLSSIYRFGPLGIAYRKRTTEIEYVTRLGISTTLEDLVPTAGVPGSDIWFTSKLIPGDNSWAPALATGRLSSLTNEEVENYLGKLKEFEQIPDTTAWKKEILHLAGGYTEEEIYQINSSVDSWKVIAEGEHYGANVSTIKRPKLNNQSNISEINVSDMVNAGLHMITFFGHSDYNVTDIDIGYASNPINHYNNKDGKYPFILLNGCSSGNCFVRSWTFGEDWINVEDKGAIGFIGHSDIGLTSALGLYTKQLYKAMFEDTLNISSPIGIQISEGIRNQTSGSTPNIQVAHIMEMLYQGDPAVRLVTAEKPDLAINNSSLFLEAIDEDGITAVSESFNLGVAIRNYGWYFQNDSFFVSVRRVLPDGTTEDYPPKVYGSVKRLDTIYYEIPSKNINAFGINQFKVHIDYNFDSASALGGANYAFNSNYDASYESGQIDEGHETNNEAAFQYFLPLSTVKPLYPTEFSIVNSSHYPVNFTAQSTDLLVTSEIYYMELDTSRTFDSPLFTAEQQGTSLVTWQNIPLPDLTDTTVYYWRVRFKDIANGEDTLWGESSFTWIPSSSEGWSQAHYEQFFKDNKESISMNELNQKWEFSTNSGYVTIKTATSGYSVSTHKMTINNQDVWWNGCTTGIRVMVLNSSTLYPTVIPGFNSRFCQSNPFRYQYHFNLNNATHQNLFQQFINNVPYGYYVVISSMNDPMFSTWDSQFGLGSILASVGATAYPTSDSLGYALVGCKNCSTSVYENSHSDTISATILVEGRQSNGDITSTVIGPSLGWDKFLRDVDIDPLEGTDEYTFDIYGLDLNLKDSLIIENIPYGEENIAGISHTEFPYLKLKMHLKDERYRTPPQLQNWLIIYDNRVPEGVLVGDGYDYSHKDYYEGQEIQYQFKFKNISENDFAEPLIVKYAFTTAQQFIELKVDTLPGILKAGEEITFDFTFPTEGFEGTKQLQIFVNPRKQIEQYYFNNIWQIPLTIHRDDVNPLLDVVFDGVHIMHGDIVSPNPKIVMTMKDDNKYVFKTDTTSDIEIFWKRPGQTIYETVALQNNPLLEFIPASEKNDFRITFSPENLENGVHYLSVQIGDAFGNKSGSMNYEIGFEVVNESSISKFYPYPNPFSTSTRFAYTLTGSEIPGPEDLKIQIMSLSGKMVREITGSELGDLRIGKHLTDYAWDGTDEFGDKLANGVYLYRVIAKLDGQTIKHRVANEFTDSNTFTKDWGKLYIMR